VLAGVVAEVIGDLMLGVSVALEDGLAVGAAPAPHPASTRAAITVKVMGIAFTIALKPP
jgi:hypothetical protein